MKGKTDRLPLGKKNTTLKYVNIKVVLLRLMLPPLKEDKSDNTHHASVKFTGKTGVASSKALKRSCEAASYQANEYRARVTGMLMTVMPKRQT